MSNDPLYNSDIFIYVHCTGFLYPMIRFTIVIYLSMYTVQFSISNGPLYNSGILSMYTVQVSYIQ